MTDQLLHEIVYELRALRREITQRDIDTCGPKEALQILGLNNVQYLKHYLAEGLLTRRKGGSGYVYYKSECHALAAKLKDNTVPVPKIRQIQTKIAA